MFSIDDFNFSFGKKFFMRVVDLYPQYRRGETPHFRIKPFIKMIFAVLNKWNWIDKNLQTFLCSTAFLIPTPTTTFPEHFIHFHSHSI